MLFRLIRAHIRPYKRSMTYLVALQLLATIATLYLPTLNADIIDNGVIVGDNNYILRIGAVMIAVTLGNVLCSVGAVFFGARTAMAVGRDLRGAVFDRVQSFSAASQVKAGHPASFAIWVWTTKARAVGVTVHAKVAYALYVGSPRFTVCPVAHRATCNVGNLSTGQVDELQLTVKVGRKAALGEQVQLSATASARKARSFTGSATDVVAVSPPKKPSPSASPSVTITLPPASLPPIAGTGTSPGNPANLFPTVSAGPVSPTPGASSIGLPPVKPHTVIHAADVAATVPLDSRLIGGQLAGLAVLAGGVAIAIARLSLRTPKPHDDATAKPSAE